MAQIIQNKYPIDTEARRAVGFGFPLNGNAVFVPTYQTRDQIKANLVNYLLTNRGERVFNPNVCNGCYNKVRLDAGDWEWCPFHKGTERQFECSKTITPQMVIEALNKSLNIY